LTKATFNYTSITFFEYFAKVDTPNKDENSLFFHVPSPEIVKCVAQHFQLLPSSPFLLQLHALKCNYAVDVAT